MAKAVQRLLQRIDLLGANDLLQLDVALARRLDRQWSYHAKKARMVAKRRKITQATIDSVIERRRYG